MDSPKKHFYEMIFWANQEQELFVIVVCVIQILIHLGHLTTEKKSYYYLESEMSSKK